MRLIFIAVGFIFLSAPSYGSPILRVIRNKEQLTAIRAAIKFEVHRFSPESSWAHFTVTWKPKNSPDKFPGQSLIFAVFKHDAPIKDPGPGRMRVIFKQDAAGVVRAEFDVALDELARAQIMFIDGQSWVDVLILKTVVDGFSKGGGAVDPFAPQKGGKGKKVSGGSSASEKFSPAGWDWGRESRAGESVGAGESVCDISLPSARIDA